MVGLCQPQWSHCPAELSGGAQIRGLKQEEGAELPPGSRETTQTLCPKTSKHLPSYTTRDGPTLDYEPTEGLMSPNCGGQRVPSPITGVGRLSGV